MIHSTLLFSYLILLSACVNNTDIKNEISSYHACITKCDDIESTNTFNFFKCSQDCVDLSENRRTACNLLKDAKEKQKCLEAIIEPRDQCIAYCQEQVTAIRTEFRTQVKKCKEICLYQLKN